MIVFGIYAIKYFIDYIIMSTFLNMYRPIYGKLNQT